MVTGDKGCQGQGRRARNLLSFANGVRFLGKKPGMQRWQCVGAKYMFFIRFTNLSMTLKASSAIGKGCGGKRNRQLISLSQRTAVAFATGDIRRGMCIAQRSGIKWMSKPVGLARKQDQHNTDRGRKHKE